MVRNNDLQAMFLLDWSHFEDFIKFPLRNTTTTKRSQGTTEDIEPSKRRVDEVLQRVLAAKIEAIFKETGKASPTTDIHNNAAGTLAHRPSPTEPKHRTTAPGSNMPNEVEEAQRLTT